MGIGRDVVDMKAFCPANEQNVQAGWGGTG